MVTISNQKNGKTDRLALFLAGEDTPRGAHLENRVLSDLLAWRDLQGRREDFIDGWLFDERFG